MNTCRCFLLWLGWISLQTKWTVSEKLLFWPSIDSNLKHVEERSSDRRSFSLAPRRSNWIIFCYTTCLNVRLLQTQQLFDRHIITADPVCCKHDADRHTAPCHRPEGHPDDGWASPTPRGEGGRGGLLTLSSLLWNQITTAPPPGETISALRLQTGKERKLIFYPD